MSQNALSTLFPFSFSILRAPSLRLNIAQKGNHGTFHHSAYLVPLIVLRTQSFQAIPFLGIHSETSTSLVREDNERHKQLPVLLHLSTLCVS